MTWISCTIIYYSFRICIFDRHISEKNNHFWSLKVLCRAASLCGRELSCFFVVAGFSPDTALVLSGSGRCLPQPIRCPRCFISGLAKEHLRKFSFNPEDLITQKNYFRWSKWVVKSPLNAERSSTYESLNTLTGWRITYTARANVLPAAFRPNGIRTHSHSAWCVAKAVNHLCSGLISNW